MEKKELKPHSSFFYGLRIYIFINCALMLLFVGFNKTCPTVLIDYMSKSYGVEKAQLGIFSSMYFYPYAIEQMFSGLLVDITDPAVLLGSSQLIAAFGAFLTGLSKSTGGQTLATFGRFLVGVGCGATLCSVSKIISFWFELKHYGFMLGIIVAVNGSGGLVASYPLAMVADNLGWEVAFFGLAVFGALLSILVLLFCRGTPESKGYEPVNPEIKQVKIATIKDKLLVLLQNTLIVIKLPTFWFIALYIFFIDGFFLDLSGQWAGPYLTDVMGFNSSKMGYTVMSFNIGIVIGAFVYPSLAKFFGKRIWVLFFSAFIGFILAIVMTSIDMVEIVENNEDGANALIFIVFLILAIVLNGPTPEVFDLVRSYYSPSVAGASIGFINCIAMLSSAIFQSISSAIIPLGGKYPDTYDEEGKKNPVKYKPEGYRVGLWALGIVCSFLGLMIIFAKSPEDKKPESQEESRQNDINESVQEIFMAQENSVKSDFGE